ncbi:helix-turn-helix domain-containing protein [Nocardiopsis aegyptia]|uniref:helix-turn-helix domain-containing protein n=1 Tax=Nocardiopsis aegyptia TaxID=220378 RepID=UPI00367151C7
MPKTLTLPALAAAIEDAMRASIARWGVLVPVVRTRDGELLDGHVRVRLAEEMGVPYPERHVEVADAEEAREVRRTLNSDRRHLTEEQRRSLAGDLRKEGHSTRAIAGALGTSKSTVDRDLKELSRAGQLDAPDTVRGLDGRERPARAAAPEHEGQDDVDLPPLDPGLPAGQDLADRIAARFDQHHAAPAPPEPLLPEPADDGPEPRWLTGRGTVTVRSGRICAALDGLGALDMDRAEAHELSDVLAAAVRRADRSERPPF